MGDINNSHIQGDLTISSTITDTGLLKTNLLQETTLDAGITINSNINSYKILKILNDSDNGANLSISNENLIIINELAEISLITGGNNGIKIANSGDVLISSTTDSIDNTTGSFITNGGAVIGKTFYVNEDINGLDGIHNLTNTTGSQNVLSIKNTANSGFSSIYFKSAADQSKLDIGYGNSTTGSPFTDTSYIQSINGSELLFRGNSTDSFKISTDGSLDFYNTTPTTSIGSGAIRVPGAITISNSTNSTSTTAGGAFSVGGGALISKDLIIGGTLNLAINTEPVAPIPGLEKLYIDSLDNLVKSKNSSNIVSTYNPTTTKGDLTAHNGTTQDRFPTSLNNSILITDSSANTGLKWFPGGNALTQSCPITQKKIRTSSYTLATSFLYRGSSVSGNITEFSFSSYKNSSTAFTYSVRIWDAINKLVMAEITGLSNDLPAVTSTTNISNIPSGETLLEFQCKLSIENDYGVILTSLNFSYI